MNNIVSNLTMLSAKVSCGNITNIPKKLPQITSELVNILMIAVPIILIIVGSIDLVKGIIASKEDEIKKGRQVFLKRIIAAVMVFFVIVVVKLIISVVSDSVNNANIVECIDCFISNNCSINNS